MIKGNYFLVNIIFRDFLNNSVQELQKNEIVCESKQYVKHNIYKIISIFHKL